MMKRDFFWVLTYTAVMAALAFMASKMIDSMWPIEIR